MIGKTFGPYRIEAQLGAGGMGVVYRAHDTRLERDVALKFLSAGTKEDPAARARLMEEARTASALNHPNICTVYDVGEAEGQAYIAMEIVAGRPLSQQIPEGGMPVDTLLHYGTQVAAALGHAHERGIVHRDLKSSNVVITPEGQVKVLDFGLATRQSPTEITELTRSQKSLGASQSVAGTLAYIAPEILRGESATSRSDIWALGVMLYEMAAGTLPFTGRTGFEISSAILQHAPEPLSARIPPGLRAIIQRCLAKEPGQRYQHAGEVRAALEAIGSASSVTTAFVTARTAAWPWWRHPATLALLAVALLGAFAIWKGPPLIGIRKTNLPPGTGSAGPKERLSNGGEPSKIPEANEYLERGYLIAMSRLDIPEMQRMYGRALEIDPKFAEARAEYAFTYVILLIQGQSNDPSLLYKAEEEARRALQDSPQNGRAHSVLAGAYQMQGRVELATGENQKALERNPNDVAALTSELTYYGSQGRYAEAIEKAQKVLAQFPLFFPARGVYADLLQEMGDNASAIREKEKIVEQAPQNLVGVTHLAMALVIAGENHRARAVLEKVSAPQRQSYVFRLRWALLLAAEGNRAEALKAMNPDVLKYAETVTFSTFEAAEFFALVNDKENALDWLDRSVRKGNERIEWFQRNPLLANLRNEPRFKQILDSIAFHRRQRQGK